PLLLRPSLFLLYCYVLRRDLHSFPTRRSSDLPDVAVGVDAADHVDLGDERVADPLRLALLGDHRVEPPLLDQDRGEPGEKRRFEDRKSTRLNSSHVSISYAVFCLKKKKQIFQSPSRPNPPELPQRTKLLPP